MPIEAMNGFFFASASLRPSKVVSTFISSNASPSGFSDNVVIHKFSSHFINPKSDALSPSNGNTAMVMSASVFLWWLTKSM